MGARFYMGTFDSDPFAYRLKWKDVERRVVWVDIEMWEIVGDDDIGPLFDDGAGGFATHDKAPVMARGYLKWDGCNEIDWVESHACGIDTLKSRFDFAAKALEAAREVLVESGTWLE